MKNIASAVALQIALLITLCTSLFGQTAIHVALGYMFPLAGAELNSYSNDMTGIAPTGSGVHSSWGKGSSCAVSLNQKIIKSFSLEAGVGYKYCSANNFNYQVSALTNSSKDRLHLFMFSLGAAYTFLNNKSFMPYLGAGINYGVDDNITATETSNDPYGYSTIFNSSLTCTPAFGGYGKLGIKHHLSSQIFLFGELSANVMSLTTKKLVVNTLVQNGANITTSLMPYQRETDYVKSISPYIFSQLQPSIAPEQSIPASSWGINVGIEINFGKVSSKKK